MDTTGLGNKYASGHKETASQMKELNLIEPGKMVASRKPFIAYYLDGYFYFDKKTQESLPKTEKEVIKLIRSKKVDYLVMDSFTLKNLRPKITNLALGLEPLPGAKVIYSKYFPEYNRIITVYKCGENEKLLPPLKTANEHYNAAVQFYKSNFYHLALKEINAAIMIGPEHKNMYFIKSDILSTYLRAIYRGERIPTMLMDHKLLPMLVETSKKSMELDPQNQKAVSVYKEFKRLLDNERAILEAHRKK